ncbi:MAG: hypothetical protein ABEN55_10855 [Bradymonadaceae bacterium]
MSRRDQHENHDDFFAPDNEGIPTPDDDEGHRDGDEWDPFGDAAPEDDLLDDGDDSRQFMPDYYPDFY